MQAVVWLQLSGISLSLIWLYFWCRSASGAGLCRLQWYGTILQHVSFPRSRQCPLMPPELPLWSPCICSHSLEIPFTSHSATNFSDHWWIFSWWMVPNMISWGMHRKPCAIALQLLLQHKNSVIFSIRCKTLTSSVGRRFSDYRVKTTLQQLLPFPAPLYSGSNCEKHFALRTRRLFCLTIATRQGATTECLKLQHHHPFQVQRN